MTPFPDAALVINYKVGIRARMQISPELVMRGINWTLRISVLAIE